MSIMNRENHIPVLYLVVPCYNEAEGLTESAHVLETKVRSLMQSTLIARASRIVFVDDGSSDETPMIIHRLHEQSELFSGISLSRNFGHQAAVLAGYLFASGKCDAVISIDADLQQDVEAIDLFLERYMAGDEIVFGVRNARDTDGWFKRMSAGLFYSFMKWGGCDTIRDHADYRLLSAKALDALAEYEETNLFLRGLVTDLGFQTSVVYFDVRERTSGTSKYTLKKMLRLAMDGITSFSVKPIHMMIWAGMLFVLIAIINIGYTVAVWLSGNAVSGWATTVISIWLLGGLQLIGMGVIGEYVGKTYFESKKRPRFIVEHIEHKEPGERI